MGTPADRPAVLVLSGGSLPGAASEDPLAGLLGASGAAALRRELLHRAVDWAEGFAAGAVHVVMGAGAGSGAGAGAGAGSGAGTGAGAGAGDGDDLAELSASLFPAGGGPLLIAWADLPRWRADHAAGALDDLADGCDVSVGPVFEGGFYLLALARPLPELFAAPDGDWLGPNAMGSAFTVAHEAGLTVGMLRAERGLRRPDDVRALLADPLTDADLGALLE